MPIKNVYWNYLGENKFFIIILGSFYQFSISYHFTKHRRNKTKVKKEKIPEGLFYVQINFSR